MDKKGKSYLRKKEKRKNLYEEYIYFWLTSIEILFSFIRVLFKCGSPS